MHNTRLSLHIFTRQTRNTCPGFAKFRPLPGTQRGVALFFALILLLVLTLLGMAALQVSTLQERMAGDYRTVNLALQRAETQLRIGELAIQTAVNATGTYLTSNGSCLTANYDGVATARALSPGFTPRFDTVQVDPCFPFGSLAMGRPKNENTTSMFQVTAYDKDRTTNASTVVAVESVYIP